MQQSRLKNLTYADVAFHGKSMDTLSKEELMDALLELVQKVYECSAEGNMCKDVFTVRRE
jgi:hypothetical protein